MNDQALFNMERLERPARPSKAGGRKWGGQDSKRARDHCRAMLPAPCPRCGGLITPEDPESTWHAGHLEDHATGGSDKDLTNFAPEHGRCNMAAGGKLGARITNGHKVEQDWTRERTLRWW